MNMKMCCAAVAGIHMRECATDRSADMVVGSVEGRLSATLRVGGTKFFKDGDLD